LAAAALPLALALAGCAKLEARDLIREGNQAYRDGKFAEAVELFDQAEKLEPDGVTLFWNRACAAESLVLKLKDPVKADERRKWADRALADFQTWYDRLEPKTEPDAQQLHDHRLALLDADDRCDDLLTYWMEKHRANPREEALYGVIARQYERCNNVPKADEWHAKRTEDFPESVRAWHSLAVRTFGPLWPEPDSGLAFNAQLGASERQAIAEKVIALLDKATAIDPKFRDAFVWRAMAYSQRSLARTIENPSTPQEKLQTLLAREDVMAAWKQSQAQCDLDGLPQCPKDKVPEAPCCPPPPFTMDEQVADATLKKQLEDEIAGGTPGKNKKRRKR
jgi:tetratricopeptide (TPR) repeat protein